MNEKANRIMVSTKVHASKEKTWEFFTVPKHIVNWNFASTEWHCPSAENDLRPGGRFSWRMEAKDGSMGFDYSGQYVRIEPHKSLELKLDDERNVTIEFSEQNGNTEVKETFQPDENDRELQKQGWQAILDHFKACVESDK